MPIVPLYDRVVIRSVAKSQTTESGIVIAAGSEGRPDQGQVVAAGPGHMLNDGTLRSLTVKVGDQVLFPEYSGTKIKVDGEDLLIFMESDLIGVLA